MIKSILKNLDKNSISRSIYIEGPVMKCRSQKFISGLVLIAVGICFIFPFILSAILKNVLLIIGIYIIFLGFCKIQRCFNRNDRYCNRDDN